MFKAEIRTDVMRNVFNALGILVDEAKFTVDENEMKIKAVDPAHVALTDIELPKALFERYEASEIELGMDIKKIKSILSLATTEETIGIEYEEEKCRLTFKIGNITRRVNTIDTSNIADVRIPPLELSSSADIPASEMMRIIRASESVSDHISIRLDAECFCVTAEGDTDNVDMVLDKDSIKNVRTSGQVRSMFPLDYMSEFIKIIPKGTDITFNLDNDMPMIAQYQISDKGGLITYLLAPRIENE